MGTLLAGTRYRSDFEERIKEVIKEREASRRLLLIDEIYTVIGAGATSGGSMDASARPTNADPPYQHLIVTTERKFWRCVERRALASLVSNRQAKDRGGAANERSICCRCCFSLVWPSVQTRSNGELPRVG